MPEEPSIHECRDSCPRLSGRAKLGGSAGHNTEPSAARKFKIPKPLTLTKLAEILVALALLISLQPTPQTRAQSTNPTDRTVSDTYVRIGVLGLFHPRQLKLTASQGQALIVQAGAETLILEKSSGLDSALIAIDATGVLVTAGTRAIRASSVIVTNRESAPTDLLLSVPGKITRHYRGRLEIKPAAGSLLAIITMDRELAVASVVASESATDTPLEALQAQAVATRSYFSANPTRHHDFDFCDTTHCQLLREPPGPQSRAAHAAAATRDLVLIYDSQPFAAMYTRSCSGRTHTPAELGFASSTYPYFPVECKYCRAHPSRWTSRISARDAATLRGSNEASRLNLVRRLGWSTVPSNDFVAKTDANQKQNGEIVLEGTGQGHGIGLCQSGAKAMAEDGATFRQILGHYYPNTTIANSPAASTR